MRAWLFYRLSTCGCLTRFPLCSHCAVTRFTIRCARLYIRFWSTFPTGNLRSFIGLQFVYTVFSERLCRLNCDHIALLACSTLQKSTKLKITHSKCFFFRFKKKCLYRFSCSFLSSLKQLVTGL